MDNKLMILGSLEEFVGLVKMAKERGIYTIVCDGYKGSPAKKIADKSYDIMVTRIDEIANICKQEGVNGIITSFSDLLFECMVKIADKAGIKCYFTPEKLPYYRDKIKMKEMFREIQVPTADFVYLEKNFKDSELKEITFPVVVKPVDKYGSRGIFVLDSIEEIRDRFDEVCETSDMKKILVEEYQDGHEFNMMTWVLDGKVNVISIADREKTEIAKGEIPISTRNVYPSRLYDKVEKQATEILQKVADFTGQKDGALSMQFFWKPETGISVCEVAGRFLGYEHELIELSGDFSVEKLLLDYVYDEKSLRESLAEHDAHMKRSCAVLYFHGRELVIEDQSMAENVKTQDNVVYSQIFYKMREMVEKHGRNPYVARYYISAATREEIDKVTAEIFDKMTIKDPKGKEVLYKNKITSYEDTKTEEKT